MPILVEFLADPYGGEHILSLTVPDTPIAVALRDAVRQLLGDSAQVHFSSNKEVSGGIQHGETGSNGSCGTSASATSR